LVLGTDVPKALGMEDEVPDVEVLRQPKGVGQGKIL
jgi:hypothetical protein